MKIKLSPKLVLPPVLLTLSLSGVAFAQNSVKDMKAVFQKIPVGTQATGQKPAMVLPVNTSHTNAAIKILMVDTTLMAIGDCPNVLVGLLKSAHSNAEVRLTEVIGEDYAFRNHLIDGSAAKTIEKAGPWDFVLLQPHSKELIYKTEETIRDGQILATMALSHQSQVFVLDTWSSNEPTAFQLTDRGNQLLSEKIRAQRIPICTALYMARNIGTARLFRMDNHHLGPDGVYLAACVMYAKLTRRSPVGLPAKVYQGSRLMVDVSAENAKQLQAIAATFIK